MGTGTSLKIPAQYWVEQDLPHIKGNTRNPIGFLRFQYNSFKPDYFKDCNLLIEHIEQDPDLKGKLGYRLEGNKGVFEVTLHQEKLCKNRGMVEIWSK